MSEYTRGVKQEIEATDHRDDIDRDKCGSMSLEEQDERDARDHKTSSDEKQPPWLMVYNGPCAPEVTGTAISLLVFIIVIIILLEKRF